MFVFLCFMKICVNFLVHCTFHKRVNISSNKIHQVQYIRRLLGMFFPDNRMHRFLYVCIQWLLPLWDIVLIGLKVRKGFLFSNNSCYEHQIVSGQSSREVTPKTYIIVWASLSLCFSWNYFPHDHARSRAYRWGEDGLLGICDREGRLCMGVALWNTKDPILKERLFGLTGHQVLLYWWIGGRGVTFNS